MTKQSKKDLCKMICIAVLLLIAYICRIPGISVSYSHEMGLVRALIYLALFLAWGFSLRNRIIQKQARRYLTAIAALMVFWFLVRTLKFHFVSSTLHPNLVRYLWYLYYLPLMFIPLLAVFVAMSIGKPENCRLPKQAGLLYLLTTVLFLLVMTNDLHQLVFTFPAEAAVWTDQNYGYAMGYYLLAIWMFLCGIIMLVQLCRKRRVSGSRRLILFPCIPIAVLILYLSLYFLRIKWLLFLAGDMTAVMCLMYAATLELCIRCGFIQANTHYLELFDASTVGAQITDEAYHVCLSSRTAKRVNPSVLRQTENGSVMLDGSIRLSSAPIHGGHVIWSEDMSALLEVLDALREAKENLEDCNGLLEEENAVKAREAHVGEQERLYRIIQQETAPQISLMDELIRQTERAETDEARCVLLKKMLVIGAYLKRRSNLVFLADKASLLDARELSLTFGESMNNLEMYGVTCGFASDMTEPVPAVSLIKMYDFFERIMELSLDHMSCLTVYAWKTEDFFYLTLNTDADIDFFLLASGQFTVNRDEDGEWQLVLRLSIGGNGV